MNLMHLFIAESIKLKSTMSLYFSLIVSILVVGLVFIGHNIDVHTLCMMNENPWLLYFNRAHCIITGFMIVPICLFLILSFFYVEHKADAQKLLYTFPNPRWQLLLVKLIVILLCCVWIFISFVLFMVVSGYLLAWRFPEYELSYYGPPIWESLKLMYHTFISCLGIIAIQYFLHRLFKSYLLPLGIGFLAFLSGFIIASMNLSLCKYHPYSYPVIVRDLNFIRSDVRELYAEGWISNLEIYSLLIFVFFIGLSILIDRRKQIK